jgi:hypothetical protein
MLSSSSKISSTTALQDHHKPTTVLARIDSQPATVLTIFMQLVNSKIYTQKISPCMHGVIRGRRHSLMSRSGIVTSMPSREENAVIERQA